MTRGKANDVMFLGSKFSDRTDIGRKTDTSIKYTEIRSQSYHGMICRCCVVLKLVDGN